jgi:hypothetical protein
LFQNPSPNPAKKRGKKEEKMSMVFFFYDNIGSELSMFDARPCFSAAVSERKLPERISGPCTWNQSRLAFNLKKGSWFTPAISGPIVLNEQVRYLGRNIRLFPDFIQRYIKKNIFEKRAKTWMACQFANGKKLYLNWYFTADAGSPSEDISIV